MNAQIPGYLEEMTSTPASPTDVHNRSISKVLCLLFIYFRLHLILSAYNQGDNFQQDACSPYWLDSRLFTAQTRALIPTSDIVNRGITVCFPSFVTLNKIEQRMIMLF